MSQLPGSVTESGFIPPGLSAGAFPWLSPEALECDGVLLAFSVRSGVR